MIFLALLAILFVGATSFMSPEVYGQWWWFAFWAVVAVGLLYCLLRGKVRARLLHWSLLLMICGGMLTALTAVRGQVHLRPGAEVCDFVDSSGQLHKLPFRLTLKKFETDYYPGMNFPRNFRSTVMIDSREVEISMNRIGREGAWRIYQQSFDSAGGSILSLSYDPWGTSVTYLGFLLFALGGLPMLFRRRRSVALLLLVGAFGVSAETIDERQVQFRGRIVPFATVASELTYKLTGEQSVAGRNPTEFVISLIEHPREWADVPFLKTKEGYVSPASLYDDRGHYLPEAEFQGGDGPRDAELLRIDEKVALLAELWRGELFEPAPEAALRPRAEVKAEVAYVKFQPVKWFFMLALAGGFLCLIFKRLRWACSLLLTVIAVGVFGWQWWIRGYFPVAGTGEIMFFTSVCLCLCSAAFVRRWPLASALAMLMAGFAALVSWLAVKNPVLTPLMPVLASPWLSVHVSLVMLSYALLAMVSLLGGIGLFKTDALALAMRLLPVGVYTLGLGIIFGALWANVSWGRYWAWDPKETWALVTMLLYALPLHPRLGLRRRALSLYLLCCFAAILMTYAGVNLLPSLHAYR